MASKRQIERRRDGSVRLRLEKDERELLRSLPGQLRELLETGDPSLRRLFPPAYGDDDAANAEYERLLRGELLTGKREALRVLQETADAETLDEEQLGAWLRALNDLRLVLGTRLDVTEEIYGEGIDPRDPRAPELALYGWLSWLQEQAVEAAAAASPGGEERGR